MVTCDKCNADNMIQAVHCVKCGALLSHFSDGGKPTKSKVKHDTTSWCYSSHDLSKVLLKSVIGLFLYALILVSILIFWPDLTVNDIALEKANASLKRARVASYSRNFELQCTENELAAVLRLGMPSFFVQGASWGTIVPRDVSVEFTGPQAFDVRVNYLAINGSIPFDVVYSIALPKSELPPQKLKVSHTALGLLPVPAALISPLVSSAKKSIEKSKIAVVISRIKWGKIEDGKLTVYSRLK